MRLVNHGGKCCGIKTIYEIFSPEEVLGSLEASHPNNKDIMYSDVSSDQRFFHLTAPVEKSKDRMKRYIDFVCKHRPSHMIEVTISTMSQKAWISVLEEFGFKLVTTFYNSNSSHTVNVYHMVIFKGKVV